MARSYFVSQRLQALLHVPQRLVWWVEYAAIATLINGLAILPLRSALRVAGTVFAVLGPYSPRATKVRNNLSVAFPEAGSAELDRLRRASFSHVGIAVAELALLSRIWRQRQRRIEFRLEPGAVMPTPEQRAVFVTAHIGAWQLTPLIGLQYGLTVPVIYAPEDNPHVDRKLAKLRRTFGGPLVSRDGGIKVLMRALDRGESIGLTMDTRMDAGEMVPFFGEHAMTNTAPARLALRYGCALVPTLAERLPGARYRVRIYPPIEPRDTTAPRRVQVHDMALQANAYFEAWIRRNPEQWLCLKRRWPKAVHRRAAHSASE